MRIGPDVTKLEQQQETFVEVVLAAVQGTLEETAARLGKIPSVDDLTVLQTLWQQRVELQLLDTLRDAYAFGVESIDNGVPSDALVASLHVGIYLENARIYLLNIGLRAWQHARDAFILGQQADEKRPTLRKRVLESTDLNTPYASEVARSSYLHFTNAAMLDRMREIGLPATKEWSCTFDNTRPSHIEANGQIVDINDKFVIGGHGMDRPYDENAPIKEWANCKCRLFFHITDDVVEDGMAASASVTAGADVQTGAMIALIPSDADLDRLVLDVPDAEPREELHLTLWYLGNAADLGDDVCTGLVNAVSHMIERRALPPMDGIAFGVNYWNPSSDDPAWVLAVGDASPDDMSEAQKEVGGFASFKHMMKEAWEDSLIFFDMPPQHTPYVPRVCLIYGAEVDTDLISAMTEKLGPITFDKVRLAFGGEVTDIPLKGHITATSSNTDCTDCSDDHEFGSSQSVVDGPWSGTPSKFTDEQYKMSTAACDPGNAPIKQKCFLPHHNPGGALNRTGLGAAAGRINSLSGRSSAAVERARSHLRSHYRALGEDPPDSLTSSTSTVEFGSRIDEMSEIERGYLELMTFLRFRGWVE